MRWFIPIAAVAWVGLLAGCVYHHPHHEREEVVAVGEAPGPDYVIVGGHWVHDERYARDAEYRRGRDLEWNRAHAKHVEEHEVAHEKHVEEHEVK